MSILSLSFSPFALVFLGALYGVAALAVTPLCRFTRSRSGQSAVIEASVPRTAADARGIIATVFAALALLSEIVFWAARPFLGDENLLLFIALLLLASAGGILAVVISSLRGLSGVKGWSYTALALATVALVALSVWLLSPALLRL